MFLFQRGIYMDRQISVSQLPTPLQGFYTAVQNELAEVETLLRNFLESENPFIQQVTHHGFRLGGKRMRPALHLLFAKMTGTVRPIHYVLGAALETIHTASLVHDDILDEAQMRRHIPTVNAVWNNETSVLMGDYMVARTMRSVVALHHSIVSETVAETSCRLCEGEMKQVGNRGNFHLSLTDYYSIIEGKTASLFECSCRLGVLCACEDETKKDGNAPSLWLENASEFGRHLGLAFQIADDLLDLLGDEEQMGKNLGSDLAKQKLTLPILRLLDVLDAESKAELISEIQNHLGPETYSRIRELMAEHQVYEYVRETAIQHIRDGLALLDVYPDSDAKEGIAGFANYVIERQQ